MNTTFQPPESFPPVTGLGAPRAWFPVKNWNRTGNLVICLLLLSASCLVLAYGLYDTYLAIQQRGPALIDDKLTVPALIAFVLFLLGLLAGWGAYANWNKGVVIYERGFAIRDRKGVRTWVWEDVSSFMATVTRHYTNGIYTGTTHVYTLISRRNERVVLSDIFKGVEQLAQSIEQSIFPILYDRAAAQYNGGQTIIFGPVSISKAGIQIGRKNYPWPEVREVSIHQGILKVTKKDGGWFSGASAMASSIPNLRVLLSIIHQVVGVKAG